MNCRGCGSAETRVEDSRDYGDVVIRGRRCEACRILFPTQEIPLIPALQTAETRQQLTLPGVSLGVASPSKTGDYRGSGSGISDPEIGSGSLSPDPKPPDQSQATRVERSTLKAKALREFAEFWGLYPRRIGKAAALRAWERLRPPLAEVKAALAWQTRSTEWRKDNGAYIPHPATWLNQGRWMDEPPRAANPIGVRATAPRPASEPATVGQAMGAYLAEKARIAATWPALEGDEDA